MSVYRHYDVIAYVDTVKRAAYLCLRCVHHSYTTGERETELTPVFAGEFDEHTLDGPISCDICLEPINLGDV